jgi:hypothetical protein
VAAVLALTAAPARAENPWGCRAKISRAVERYDAAVDRYGSDSPKAYKERLKVEQIKDYCYRLFGEWWDPHSNRWHREHW